MTHSTKKLLMYDLDLTKNRCKKFLTQNFHKCVFAHGLKM